VSLAVDRYDYIRDAQIAGKPEQSIPDKDGIQLPPLQDGRMVGGPLLKQQPQTGVKPADPGTEKDTAPAPQDSAPQQ
jgi:hypothetical protein